MMRQISVAPMQSGWTVRSDVVDNPMVFLSGAKAEAAAKGLGRRIAATGEGAEIHILLRDGSVAGRFRYAPDTLPLAS